jgi:hypothetical protein
MTQPLNLGNCCGSSIPGIRKIAFPDGDQLELVGLDTTFEAVFKEGKLPDDSTVIDLISSIEACGIKVLAMSKCASIFYYNGENSVTCIFNNEGGFSGG